MLSRCIIGRVAVNPAIVVHSRKATRRNHLFPHPLRKHILEGASTWLLLPPRTILAARLFLLACSAPGFGSCSPALYCLHKTGKLHVGEQKKTLLPLPLLILPYPFFLPRPAKLHFVAKRNSFPALLMPPLLPPPFPVPLTSRPRPPRGSLSDIVFSFDGFLLRRRFHLWSELASPIWPPPLQIRLFQLEDVTSGFYV